MCSVGQAPAGGVESVLWVGVAAFCSAYGLGRMQTTKKLAAWGITLVGLFVGVFAFKSCGALRAPIPETGRVIDAVTGKPIANATLETSWRLYDYPMLDGAGSYEIASTTTTNSDGSFSLVIPKHRPGIWNTETYPPIVTAPGYRPFTLSDWDEDVIKNGIVTISMKPEEP